jgi:phage-related protein
MYNPLYFIFNNVNSLDIKGLTVLDDFPQPNAPNRRVVKTPIAGRSGDLRVLQNDDYGADVYDSIEKTITVCYKGNNFDLIKNWLRGDGDLLLSNQPDRYFKASIDNIISITQLSKQIKTFSITFSCFPYAFLKVGKTPIIYTPGAAQSWQTILNNDYDAALPLIKIYAAGDVGILINGVETDLYSIVDFIICDSEIQECYNGAQNLGMNMKGQFPIIGPGSNTIIFTGNIKQLELTPRWRIL